MDFLIGVFALAYGVAGLWAITANDLERRTNGLRPGELRRAAAQPELKPRVDFPSQKTTR